MALRPLVGTQVLVFGCLKERAAPDRDLACIRGVDYPLDSIFQTPAPNATICFSFSLLAGFAAAGTGGNLKFKSWYKYYRANLEDAASQCAPELELYWQEGPVNLGINGTYCTAAQNCLLGSLNDYITSNMGTSTVLLGLTPTILALIGPTLSEAAMLVVERPIFASLILLASPAMNPVPFMSNFELGEYLESEPSAAMIALGASRSVSSIAAGARHSGFKMSSKGPLAIAALSAAQYLIALAAIANTIHNTITLDLRTSVSWRCSAIGMQEIWNTLAVFICWVAGVGLWQRLRVKPTAAPADFIPVTAASEKPQAHRKTWSSLSAMLSRWIASEPTPRLFQPQPGWSCRIGPSNVVSEILYWVASCMLLAHYVFGTLVLSSLLFISVNDAAIVLMRYAMSAICCRWLVWFEMESLRLRIWESRSAAENIATIDSEQSGNDNSKPR
ncbi:hypothetical protein BX600DRAFT_493574 [Xylariales sp. PMI_506]|nr:hypothetical protein BX600DRAFT_493574 [Xylariales sp. PMI_506]